MSKRKKEIISLEKAVYLIMNEELSDVDLENSDEEENENMNPVLNEVINDNTRSSSLDLDTSLSTGKGTISIGNKSLEVEIENFDEELSEEELNISKTKILNKSKEENGILRENNKTRPTNIKIPKKNSKTTKIIKNYKNKKSEANSIEWKNVDHTPFDTTFHEHFSPPPDEILTPLEYFKFFCDDEVIDNLVYQTNLYSCQKTGTSINTNNYEMEVFLGIHFMSGLVKMPSYKHYWSERTRYSLIADCMPRNRFSTLRTYLHVNDNNQVIHQGQSGYDRLFKIRPLIDCIRNNLQKLEKEEHMSVDEFIIPFKGRSVLKQYIKNKPHKWGIKVFALAGASGMLYDFEIYVGKDTMPNKTDLGISGDIVLRLAEGIPSNKNFKLYIDNWFTSYNLAVKLQEKGILMAGTVRSNRTPSCPSDKSEKHLKINGRGSYDYKTDDKNITIVKWLDNKVVTVISTFCGVNPVTQVKRWSGSTKTKIDAPRPHSIGVYNKGMGGVDIMDMLIELYRVNIRGKR